MTHPTDRDVAASIALSLPGHKNVGHIADQIERVLVAARADERHKVLGRLTEADVVDCAARAGVGPLAIDEAETRQMLAAVAALLGEP